MQDDGGKRCTYVPHEFSAVQRDQLQLYRIVVSHYVGKPLTKLVTMHCANIRNHFSTQQDGDVDEDEGSELEKKYKASISLFRTLLCDCKDFRSDDAAEAYFERCDLADFETFVKCQEGRIQELLDTFGLDCGKAVFDVTSIAELTRVLYQVSKPPDSRVQQPHRWPWCPKSPSIGTSIYSTPASCLLTCLALGTRIRTSST